MKINEGIKMLVLATTVTISGCGENYDYDLERQETGDGLSTEEREEKERQERLGKVIESYFLKIKTYFSNIGIERSVNKKVYLGYLPIDSFVNHYHRPSARYQVYAKVVSETVGKINVYIYVLKAGDIGHREVLTFKRGGIELDKN